MLFGRSFSFKFIIILFAFSVLLLGNTSVQFANTAPEIGEYVQFGKYYNEPILWRIINVDANGNLLLFSEDIISIKVFDASGSYFKHQERADYGSNNWEFSNIRQWLNSKESLIDWTQNDPSVENVFVPQSSYAQEAGFLNASNFTAKEYDAIVVDTHKVLLSGSDQKYVEGGTETHIINKDSDYSISTALQNYDSAYYKKISDRVFLLSIKELSNYVYDRGFDHIKSPSSALISNTTYTHDNFSTHSNWQYYLRTPSAYSSMLVRAISQDGGCGQDFADYDTAQGIAPALYLDSNKIGSVSGEGTIVSPFVFELKQSVSFNESPSTWAKESVEKAYENKFAGTYLFDKFQSSISRKEFSELIVNLYNAMSNEEATLPEVNIFKDTNDQYVLKANALGIVSGKGEGVFAPNDNITRQEMAVMFDMLIKALDLNPIVTMNYVTFADEAEISGWAKNSVQLLNKLQILNGIGNNSIAPLGYATREQAMAMVVRFFEKF